MSVHYYINKDGDRKIGKPEHIEMYAKIGYAPEDQESPIVEDQNGDGEVSETEAEEARLKAICDEKGIKYDGRNGIDSLNKKIDAYEAEQAE
jgi:hypothetical protein